MDGGGGVTMLSVSCSKQAEKVLRTWFLWIKQTKFPIPNLKKKILLIHKTGIFLHTSKLGFLTSSTFSTFTASEFAPTSTTFKPFSGKSGLKVGDASNPSTGFTVKSTPFDCFSGRLWRGGEFGAVMGLKVE
ncbi:hypothetical protein GBA52_020808 [Prunus armeniaca]|nr:hypothetical protein GBA52_020808 [Prunus armeniaca]